MKIILRAPDSDFAVEVDVSHFDGYLRGPDNKCAFCKDDPRNEDKNPESVIHQYYDAHPDKFGICPVCDELR